MSKKQRPIRLDPDFVDERVSNPCVVESPLGLVRAEDINTVEFDGAGEHVVVDFLMRPFPEWSRTIADTKTFFLTRDAPQYLVDAASAFTAALVRAIRDDVDRTAAPLPCTTCTGACCVGWDVRVTAEDVAIMRSAGVPDLEERLVLRPAGDISPSGHVGKFAMKERKNPQTGAREQACINLDPKTGWCTIWDARPSVCRTYDPFACDRHDAWTDKPKDGRVRLPVVK